MTRLMNPTLLAATFLFSFSSAGVIRGGDWTSPVEVRHDVQKCVSYRARLDRRLPGHPGNARSRLAHLRHGQ